MKAIFLTFFCVLTFACGGLAQEPGSSVAQQPDDLFRAVKRSRQDPALAMERVKALVSQGADVNIFDRYGVSPLAYAADIGDLEMTKFLWRKGAKHDCGTERPLIVAAGRGRLEIVKFYIEQGVPADTVSAKGLTALDAAKSANQDEVVKYLSTSSAVIGAKTLKLVKLPQPRTSGGMPLMQALKERKSGRDYSQKKLSLQTLSDLLWAGFGVSRADGRRTAPSAANVQEIDIYIAKADGLFRYDAQGNSLELINSGDIRGLTGVQPFVKDAAVNLIYVADYSKKGRFGTQKDSWASMDTGFIAENVYLFCASEGLSTVARGLFGPDALSKAMKLRQDQKIMLTQSIGYPK